MKYTNNSELNTRCSLQTYSRSALWVSWTPVVFRASCLLCATSVFEPQVANTNLCMSETSQSSFYFTAENKFLFFIIQMNSLVIWWMVVKTSLSTLWVCVWESLMIVHVQNQARVRVLRCRLKFSSSVLHSSSFPVADSVSRPWFMWVQDQMKSPTLGHNYTPTVYRLTTSSSPSSPPPHLHHLFITFISSSSPPPPLHHPHLLLTSIFSSSSSSPPPPLHLISCGMMSLCVQ